MTSTSDQKPEYLFANCEQCRGIIRIPITVRPDSSVSCPHCESHFQLSSILDQQVPEIQFLDGTMPPSLNISVEEVSIDTGGGAEQLDGKFVVPAQLAAGIKKRRGRRRRRSSAERSAESVPSSNGSTRPLSEAEENQIARREDRAKRDREKLNEQRAAAAARKVALKRGSSSKGSGRGSRRKSSKRSPILETLKIIVGGLLAVPIAYLLLMWLFSRDPLALAPTIHDYAPALVPAVLILDDTEAISTPAIEGTEDRYSDSLPIPDTDPDDIDPEMIDLNL